MINKDCLFAWSEACCKALVVVAVFLFAGSAMAQTTPEYVWYEYGLSAGPYWASDSAACRALHGSTASAYYVSDTTSTCKYTLDAVLKQGKTVKRLEKTPCLEGYTRNMTNGACEPIPKCAKDDSLSLITNVFSGDKDSSEGMPRCNSGCIIDVEEVLRCYSYPESQYPQRAYCDFMVKKPGGECTPTGEDGNIGTGPGQTTSPTDISAPTESGDGSCPAGTTQGGTDSSGIPICMGSGTYPKAPQAPPTTTKQPPSTTTSPDGSSTTVETITQTNKDGSTTTTTKTTTTGADGSTTTATDITVSDTASGRPGKTDTDPADDKYDLCKTNPGLTICKNSQVSGTCGQISCVGDAIQCATLRAAAKMECRGQAEEDALKNSPLYALGQSAIAGTDGGGLPSLENATTYDVPTSLDQSGFIGTVACMADKTFTVQGQSVTIPFSQACDILLVLRYAIMVVASLVSFRILSGAILSE